MSMKLDCRFQTENEFPKTISFFFGRRYWSGRVLVRTILLFQNDHFDVCRYATGKMHLSFSVYTPNDGVGWSRGTEPTATQTIHGGVRVTCRKRFRCYRRRHRISVASRLRRFDWILFFLFRINWNWNLSNENRSNKESILAYVLCLCACFINQSHFSFGAATTIHWREFFVSSVRIVRAWRLRGIHVFFVLFAHACWYAGDCGRSNFSRFFFWFAFVSLHLKIRIYSRITVATMCQNIAISLDNMTRFCTAFRGARLSYHCHSSSQQKRWASEWTAVNGQCIECFVRRITLWHRQFALMTNLYSDEDKSVRKLSHLLLDAKSGEKSFVIFRNASQVFSWLVERWWKSWSTSPVIGAVDDKRNRDAAIKLKDSPNQQMNNEIQTPATISFRNQYWVKHMHMYEVRRGAFSFIYWQCTIVGTVMSLGGRFVRDSIAVLADVNSGRDSIFTHWFGASCHIACTIMWFMKRSLDDPPGCQ